jgi:phage shock protein PspC (stress-responsive transcriptional regulator)
MQTKRLYKSNDKKLDGVCAGIAEYFDIDPTLIRLLWVLGTIFVGAGILAYIIAAIVMPRKPEDTIISTTAEELKDENKAE